MIVYISGPITGIEDGNRAAFYEAEADLCAAGWYVFNPIRIDEEHPIDRFPTWEASRAYAARDLGILVKAMKAEDGDAIVLLPGWRQSPGASAEWRVAMWIGLDVFYSVEEAVQWSPKNSLQLT